MAAAVLGACGGSSGEETVDTADSTPTTTIDLADGALIRNDGERVDANGTPDTTPTTTGGLPDAAVSTTVASDAATETTVAGGASTDGAGSTSTTGDAAGSTTDGSTDGGTTGDGTASGAAIGPGEGELLIDGVSYRFETELCQIADDAADIGGRGTTSDSARFEASIFFEIDDIDEDGTPERVLDIFVDVDSDDPDAAVPAFAASTLDILGDGTGGDLTFEIVGQRITGSGSIFDFNGVAFPRDDPGSLTFDVRCA